MNSYYLTIGVKYRDGSHPSGMSPDHYIKIIAPDMDSARALALQHFGDKWAFIYEADEMNVEDFPGGEFTTLHFKPE